MYKNIATQRLKDPLFAANGIEADVMRLDLIHPQISGNKWFKLKYHLEEAEGLGKKGLVSFGGAFSNHLVAMAFACRERGVEIYRNNQGRRACRIWQLPSANERIWNGTFICKS